MTTVKIDTSGLSKLLSEVAGAHGIDAPRLMRAEVATTLRTCIARTPVPTAGKVSREAHFRSGQESMQRQGASRRSRGQPAGTVRMNTTKAVGRGWFRSEASGTSSPHFVRVAAGYSPVKSAGLGAGLLALVAREASEFRESVQRKKEAGKLAAGLAAASWLQAARALGLDLLSVGAAGGKLMRAMVARASNGRSYVNGSGSQTSSRGRVSIVVTNSLPYNQRIGLPAIMSSVIRGRAKYAAENLKRGVFSSIESVGKRYPFFRVG